MLWHFWTSWPTSDAAPPHQRPHMWVMEGLWFWYLLRRSNPLSGQTVRNFVQTSLTKRQVVSHARRAGFVLQHNYCRLYNFFSSFCLKLKTVMHYIRLWPECISVPEIFLHVIIINAKHCRKLSRLINATLLDYRWMYFTTSVLCAVLYVQCISLCFSSNACKTAICTFRISAANESLSASQRSDPAPLLSHITHCRKWP